MKRSTQRILTTHTGSLPRPRKLLEMLLARDTKQLTDEQAFQAEVKSAVAQVVRAQAETGIDVINDGEQGKSNYATYIRERMTGFGPGGEAMLMSDLAAFPEYYERVFPAAMRVPMGACTGAVSYVGRDELDRDIQNLKQVLSQVSCEEGFMSASSPGVISHFLNNEHYSSDEAYLNALADVMKIEYDALHRAGFLLQVDCPDLAMARHQKGFAKLSLSEFRKAAELHVQVLNRALADIPAHALRMHLCWGNYEGPHHHDIELKDIIDIVFQARPAGVVVEAANPRHEHEWQLFEKIKLPPDKVLIPGVIDTCTNFVEHPELVAQRICRWAKVAGRENIIAGTDCGFASGAAFMTVDPGVVWLKLKSMVEGARLASKQLW